MNYDLSKYKKIFNEFEATENSILRKKYIPELLDLQKKIEKNDFWIKLDLKHQFVLLYLFGRVKIGEAKILLIENNYIIDDIWQFSKFREEDFNIIVEKYEKSIEYLERSKKLFNNNKEIFRDLVEVFNDCDNKIRLSYQDLSNIFYFNENTDLFLEYSEIAVEKNSIAACANLVRYYCDLDDLSNAFFYFKKCIDIQIKYDEHPNVISSKLISQCMAHSYLYHYLFNKGYYEEAKEVAVQMKLRFSNIDLGFNSVVEEFIKNCDERINLINKDIEFPGLYDYFDKEVIGKMDSNIKVYINTSLEIYSYLNSMDMEMDYSASLMPIMKAVETLLYDIIVKNFLAYLKTKENVNLNSISRNFVREGKIIDNIDRCEYGDAYHSIVKKDNKVSLSNDVLKDDFVPKNEFFEYCKINNLTNCKDTIKEFGFRLYKLKDMRNKVAHRNRVFKADAEWCNELLIEKIKFIEFLYKNFGFCFKD